jgi:thymidylate synthase (FAD)
LTLKVYLIGRPQIDVDSFLLFLRDQNTGWERSKESKSAEEIVEAAGRVCYMSFGEHQSPKTNLEYIQHLVLMGHESVLEHVSWTFVLSGISRAFTHQLVRHRIGFSFSQLSQQYHDESEATFVQPRQLDRFPRALEAWQEAIRAAQRAYRLISEELKTDHTLPELERKELSRAMRSSARSVLPNATETKIVMTANARALRHFLALRGAIPGDLEMREVAASLLELLRAEAPALFQDFLIERLSDGSPIVRRGHTVCNSGGR